MSATDIFLSQLKPTAGTITKKTLPSAPTVKNNTDDFLKSLTISNNVPSTVNTAPTPAIPSIPQKQAFSIPNVVPNRLAITKDIPSIATNIFNKKQIPALQAPIISSPYTSEEITARNNDIKNRYLELSNESKKLNLYDENAVNNYNQKLDALKTETDKLSSDIELYNTAQNAKGAVTKPVIPVGQTIKFPFMNKGIQVPSEGGIGAGYSFAKSAIEFPEKAVRTFTEPFGLTSSNSETRKSLYAVPSYAEVAGKTTQQLIDQGVPKVAAVILGSSMGAGEFANDALIYAGLLENGAKKATSGTAKITNEELKTAHEFLGSPKTLEEAHANYLKLQKEFHPDITGGNDTISKQANNAYEILKREGIPTGKIAGVNDMRPTKKPALPLKLPETTQTAVNNTEKFLNDLQGGKMAVTVEKGALSDVPVYNQHGDLLDRSTELHHGTPTGKLSLDNNGNINMGIDKNDIAKFAGDNGKVISIHTKDYNTVKLPNKTELFNGATIDKQKYLDKGIDILLADNHAIVINPEKVAKLSNNELQPHFGDNKIPKQDIIKNYKTPEEFIKAQGTPVYHGTLEKFKNFDIKKAGSNSGWENAKFGTFFLDDAQKAKEFPELTRMIGDNRPVNVKEAYINLKNPIDLRLSGIFNNEKQAPTLLKILGTEDGKPIKDPKKALQYLNDNIDLDNIGDLKDALYGDIKNKKIMQDAGYDGILSDYGDGITEKVVFDTKQIKTKEQLKNIWNKANKPALPKSNIPNKKKLDTLHKELHNAYKKQGDIVHSKIQDILNELDLAEAGYKVFIPQNRAGNTKEVKAVHSTFPSWIPDGQRTTKALENIRNVIKNLDTMVFPSRGNASGQRLLVNEMFNVLDHSLGIDTSGIRADILKEYGEVKENVSSVDNRGEQKGRGETTARKTEIDNKHIKDLQQEIDSLKYDIETGYGFDGKLSPEDIQKSSEKLVELENQLNELNGGKQNEFVKAIESTPESKDISESDKTTGFEYNPEAGFINIEPLAKGIDNVKDFIKETGKGIDASGNLDDSLYTITKNAEADKIMAMDLIKKTDVSNADAEAIYHYEEDKSLPLTDKQKEVYDNVIKPLADATEKIVTKLKPTILLSNMELPFDVSTYTPRFVQGKGNIIDRIKRSSENIGKGSVLGKNAPSLKKRVMKMAIDENGNKQLIAIKNGQIYSVKNNKYEVISKTQARVSPKIKEFFDPEVRNKLEKLAKDLGITHERYATPPRGVGLGGKRAGVAFMGENIIRTRLSPDSVLAHEIGHQIDHKYGMQDFMKEERYDNERRLQVQNEMRILADTRFAGKDVTPSFKKYVRQGTEKMAVMFEAYISNKDMFKEVAPHLYSDFSDFLYSHEELRPFADIEGSTQLDSQILGGKLLSGKKGNVFVDKNGKTHTIIDATTKEIEANTDLKYHKNVFVNRLVTYLNLRSVERATDFLEAYKASPEFNEIGKKFGETDVPENWTTTVNPSFRGYLLDPHVANVMDKYASSMVKGKDPLRALSGMNSILRNAIFFNPLIHIPNIGVHWMVNRGTKDFLNPIAYGRLAKTSIRAIKAVVNMNDDYVEMLRSGAPLLYSNMQTRNMHNLLLAKMSDEVKTNPKLEFLKSTIKNLNPYILSGKATWMINDIAVMQAVYEEMAKGKTMEEAIADVGSHIPNYRLPSNKFIQLLSNPNITMFGAYHYGALKSYVEMAKTLVTGNTEGVLNYGAKTKWKARMDALDKIIMLGIIALVIYPAIDKALQKSTGNKFAKIRRAGAVTFPYNVAQLTKGDIDISQFLQSVITPAVGTKELLQQASNIDLFTGNKIRTPGASGSEQLKQSFEHFKTAVAPVAQYEKVASGKQSGSSFGAGLIGISLPKDSSAKYVLNSMIYDQRPQTMKKIKQLRTDGKPEEAETLRLKFNQDFEKQARKYAQDNGKSLPVNIEGILRGGLIPKNWKSISRPTILQRITK